MLMGALVTNQESALSVCWGWVGRLRNCSNPLVHYKTFDHVRLTYYISIPSIHNLVMPLNLKTCIFSLVDERKFY